MLDVNFVSRGVCWKKAVMGSNKEVFLKYYFLCIYDCSPANRPGFIYEQLLPRDISSHVIDSLEEDKKYTVSIYAVYPEGPSKPVSVVGKTCKFISLAQNPIIMFIYINRKAREHAPAHWKQFINCFKCLFKQHLRANIKVQYHNISTAGWYCFSKKY